MKRFLFIKQLSFFFGAISLLLFSATVSFAQWSNLNPEIVGGTLSARYSSEIAEIGEDKIVLFGGLDVDPFSDTWLFETNENRWTKLSPTQLGGTLTARGIMSFSYIGGDQILMFGGHTGSACLNDTWLFDLSDNSWTKLAPSVVDGTLGVRYGASMCYIGGGRVLLFGGYDLSNFLNETWIFDLNNNTWTKLTPTITGGTLSNRRHAGLAYLSNNKILMYGGDNANTYFNDTWIYDVSANEWAKQSPTYYGGSLSGLTGAKIRSVGEHKAVMFGGRFSSYSYGNLTWFYDFTSNQWSKLDMAGADGLPASRAFIGVWNFSVNKMILFGGKNSSTKFNDTWLLRIPEAGADSMQYENLSTGVQITWSWNLPADFTGISFFVYKNGQKVSSAITQGTQENGAIVFSYTDENIVSGTIGKYQISEVNSYTGIETIYTQELVVPYCQ